MKYILQTRNGQGRVYKSFLLRFNILSLSLWQFLDLYLDILNDIFYLQIIGLLRIKTADINL